MAARFALPASLDGLSAASLRQALLERRGTDLDLDGGSVERMTGLGLQVLVAALKTWTAEGRNLRLTSPSLELTQRLALFGAQDLFTA